MKTKKKQRGGERERKKKQTQIKMRNSCGEAEKQNEGCKMELDVWKYGVLLPLTLRLFPNTLGPIVTGSVKSVNACLAANRSVMGTLGFSPKLLRLVRFHVSGAETWIPHWHGPR